ncbi:hypothetical protein BRYFOR_05585 [Marvinbryantia formatexigens DSM 14469]|uniref:Uncharacterized protein n=1 Tax=Marvinbryantia formatexigens DSM 14469 TaxID=478749 RepID=C6LAE3_9FIRM|nr:hypothetical protein BRYFOR_05585 [Marvinbryantia formatexigens DSM 14469]
MPTEFRYFWLLLKRVSWHPEKDVMTLFFVRYVLILEATVESP